MNTSPMTANRPAAALARSRFLDIDHATVRTFTREAVGTADTDRDKARRLFAAVRDEMKGVAAERNVTSPSADESAGMADAISGEWAPQEMASGLAVIPALVRATVS